jgi:hypothetical protein
MCMNLVGELSQFNWNLASLNWQGRLNALVSLQSICVEWDAALGGSSGLAAPNLQRRPAVEDNVNVIEKQLASYYCQTFYDHFGQAPILLH